jgi:serine phosphatase RsbU (regulator of sigma subunit)
VEAASGIVDWAVATRALAGEATSGDLHVVSSWRGGTLVAVIDGLGHGIEAADAAQAAAVVLSAHDGGPLDALLASCHAALRPTRGAVITVAAIDHVTSTLTWVGVGDVEAVLFRSDPAAPRARETILLRNGIVGGQLPALRPATFALTAGDTLVMATDGVAQAFVQSLPPGAPGDVAARILETHGKLPDDALVLVARYRGSRP